MQGKSVAFLVAPEGVEQVELTEPWNAVREAGGTAVLVSTREGLVQAFNHLDAGDTFPVDAALDGSVEGAAATAAGFDALVLPGGVANPDQLRTDPAAVAFVGAFFATGKPVAAICHAPWTLIEADVVRGRTVTSWPSLRTDLENAGAHWTDQRVEVCSAGPAVLVTSRKPDDLPAFNEALVEQFAKA
ncbi:type 1 glutamine amidotransferase domain-containing protein [Kitasatospora sp. NBC_00315]|uniref:type 1 glutamine amidotransferase domain-containing protein n=1 Tax=Kitasatospora sp. NBC_00315 TaxID=2975963 RepID=UPI00352C23A8